MLLDNGGIHGQTSAVVSQSEDLVIVAFIHCSDKDVWMGTWVTPPRYTKVEYKYFIYSDKNKKDGAFEWLGEERGIINRALDISSKSLHECLGVWYWSNIIITVFSWILILISQNLQKWHSILKAI